MRFRNFAIGAAVAVAMSAMSGGVNAGPGKFSPECDTHPHTQACKDLLAGDAIEAAGISVAKELVDGPFLFDLAAYLAAGDGVYVPLVDDISGDVHADANDAAGIVVGLDQPQHFEVTITVANTSGDLEEDLVLYDVVPADFNPDPFMEDAKSDATFDTCTDGICDGVELAVDGGTCFVTAAKPDGAFSGPKDPANEPFSQRHKEPELLTLVIDSLDDGESCAITLHLVTDGNPGLSHISVSEGSLTGPANDEANWDCLDLTDGTVDDCVLGSDQMLLHTQYEPGKCELITDVTPFPVFDTVTLNDGVKLFVQDGASDDAFDDAFREIGPVGSLQLTPNGIDPGDPDVFGEAFCVPPVL